MILELKSTIWNLIWTLSFFFNWLVMNPYFFLFCFRHSKKKIFFLCFSSLDDDDRWNLLLIRNVIMSLSRFLISETQENFLHFAFFLISTCSIWEFSYHESTDEYIEFQELILFLSIFLCWRNRFFKRQLWKYL